MCTNQIPQNTEELYIVLKQNPFATVKELQEKLGIAERTVKKYIAQLKEYKLIERIGNNKKGYWKVLE